MSVCGMIFRLILQCIISAQSSHLQTQTVVYRMIRIHFRRFSAIFFLMKIECGNLRIICAEKTGQKSDPETADSIESFCLSMVPQIPVKFPRIIVGITHLEKIPLQHRFPDHQCGTIYSLPDHTIPINQYGTVRE